MKHDIIVKFVPEVKGKDYQLFLNKISDLFSTRRELEGIRGVHFYQNIVDRPNRYDLIIEIEMEREALDNWDKSAIHKQWKEQYGQYVESKAIIDLM